MRLRLSQMRFASALHARLREGRLTCADAFALAHEWHVAPLDVAEQAEELGIRIGWCQLGLFVGEKKGEKGWLAGPQAASPQLLRATICLALEEGRLSCARAWGVAERLGEERLAVGQAADALGIRISHCQLGCFE